MPADEIIIIGPKPNQNLTSADGSEAAPQSSYADARAMIDQAEAAGTFVRIVNTA